MAVFILPNEIIIEIVKHLDKEQDINRLICVSRRFHYLFNGSLYYYNLKIEDAVLSSRLRKIVVNLQRAI